MLDGVLHQGLHDHRGNPRLLGVVAGPNRKLEPVAETRPLDIEVSADGLQFFVQSHPLPFGAPQGIAKHLRQLLDGPFGAIRAARNQSGNRIQRVEHEVRIDLCAQRPQLRLLGFEQQVLLAPLPPGALLAQVAGYRAGTNTSPPMTRAA